jgi:plasmid stabilization system protein ParE
MAKIRWTEEAATWLEDIYNYIAEDNSDSAHRVVKGIYDKAKILRNFPVLGYHYRTEPEGEIRVLLYGHYKIAYLLKQDDIVEILGVFHGSLDIDRYL